MKIITENKTTELMKLAHGTNKLIVCHNTEEAHKIFDRAKELKYDIHLPITYHDFYKKAYYAHGVHSLLIDNADALIQYFATVEVEAVTIGFKQ